MKLLLITALIADIICCGWIALQFSIMKLPTDLAVENIEKSYLRNDLTDNERNQFEFYKSWILGNQKATSSNLRNTKVGALFIGALLFVQNAVILSGMRKKRNRQDVPPYA